MPLRLFTATLSILLLASLSPTLYSQTKPKAPATKPAPKAAPKVRKFPAAPAPAVRLDLNSASRAELMKLTGITAAYADKIIAGRPYLSKAHLVTRRILPMEVFVAIKNQVAARTPKP